MSQQAGWGYKVLDKPKVVADDIGRLSLDREENKENLTTWVFEEGTFVPQAKIIDGKTYSIISDYLGTPILSFDEQGKKVWERELDIYGKAKKGDSRFIPFLYQGQYYDAEIELAYNRFRYYDPESGTYISQDPIQLDGGKNFYAYVPDVNSWVDVFGLSGTHGHHSDPKFMGGKTKQPLTTMTQPDHVQLHRDMNAHLETKINPNTGTSMRPKRGNSGAIIRERFTRTERLDALSEFYSKNKKKYPKASADFFAQHPTLQKAGCK